MYDPLKLNKMGYKHLQHTQEHQRDCNSIRLSPQNKTNKPGPKALKLILANLPKRAPISDPQTIQLQSILYTLINPTGQKNIKSMMLPLKVILSLITYKSCHVLKQNIKCWGYFL